MSSTFSPNFLIKNFNIHNVEGASCINIGNNAPSGFESYKKHNQGFGSVSGDQNTIKGIKSLLNDKALIDMIDGTSGDDMPWLKELISAKLEDMEEDDIEDINGSEDESDDDDIRDMGNNITDDGESEDRDDDDDAEDRDGEDDDENMFDLNDFPDFWK